MNKFKLFLKATQSRLFNHMSDYEDSYEEGWSEGQREGFSEGWSAGKTDAEKLWKELYKFLDERKLLDVSGETNSFDMMESLLQYESDLKRTKAERRSENRFWRNDAFESAAQIADRYNYDPQIGNDIRAMIEKDNANLNH